MIRRLISAIPAHAEEMERVFRRKVDTTASVNMDSLVCLFALAQIFISDY